MFEVTRHDGAEQAIFGVKADFTLPVSIPCDQEWMNSEMLFKTATFKFSCTCSVSNLALVSSALPVGVLIGIELRKHFIGTFGHQYSNEVIERALRYMADTMGDPNFSAGLLSNLPPGPQKNEYGFAYFTGGFVPSKHSRSDFSERAYLFSRSEVFMQKVKHPFTGENKSLRAVIMTLNDHCGWTREQIADWLETLDIDISMKPKEEVNV